MKERMSGLGPWGSRSACADAANCLSRTRSGLVGEVWRWGGRSLHDGPPCGNSVVSAGRRFLGFSLESCVLV